MQKGVHNNITFAVVGRSGSGKGTQARFVVKKLGNAWRIETGKLLRTILKRDNPTTERARELMREGRIFPHWFAIFVWLKEFIDKGKLDRYIVFDGSPRTVFEAELMDEVMAWHARPLPLCIYVDVREQEATRRMLTRGRRDDTPAAIRHRMEYFPKFVLPVIRYYKKHGRLISVDGNKSVPEVWREIDTKLHERIGTVWQSQ